MFKILIWIAMKCNPGSFYIIQVVICGIIHIVLLMCSNCCDTGWTSPESGPDRVSGIGWLSEVDWVCRGEWESEEECGEEYVAGSANVEVAQDSHLSYEHSPGSWVPEASGARPGATLVSSFIVILLESIPKNEIMLWFSVR